MPLHGLATDSLGLSLQLQHVEPWLQKRHQSLRTVLLRFSVPMRIRRRGKQPPDGSTARGLSGLDASHQQDVGYIEDQVGHGPGQSGPYGKREAQALEEGPPSGHRLLTSHRQARYGLQDLDVL